jgi:hypothetical protein
LVSTGAVEPAGGGGSGITGSATGSRSRVHDIKQREKINEKIIVGLILRKFKYFNTYAIV